ncbi:Unknown protein, partial [Striga hermonthica]
FRDYHAEKFLGQGDPRIVDEWIQGLEFIFEVIDCPDRYRVICAQLQLTGDARLWWNAYWSMRPGEKAGCTWEMLKELVREKYYPTYYRAEMEHQFLSLQQGTRTVDEYEREFNRLAAFVLVCTEAQRAQHFIDGLYIAVRHNIVGHGTQTYARAVSIAQEVDASIRREAVRDHPQPSVPSQSSSVPPSQQSTIAAPLQARHLPRESRRVLAACCSKRYIAGVDENVQTRFVTGRNGRVRACIDFKDLGEPTEDIAHVNHITICEDAPIKEEDAEDAPPKLEEGVKSTVDELKEINLGDVDDPRPTYISALLTVDEEKAYIELLGEFKDVFAWSYKEMPGLDPKVPIKFNGVTVKADLYALPLVGPDVVLGVKWLEGLGKVTTDYQTGIMEFNSR